MMKHFMCIQILLPELRPSVSLPVGIGGLHDRGEWPALGARVELGDWGADCAFRIVKSETMKRVDHKR